VPVLAYVPDLDDLEYAMALASGSALAVVGSTLLPLRGWATWLGALDLPVGLKTSPLDSQIMAIINRLAYYGNNRYSDVMGKQMPRNILAEMTSQGTLDRDMVLGATLAGVSAGE